MAEFDGPLAADVGQSQVIIRLTEVNFINGNEGVKNGDGTIGTEEMIVRAKKWNLWFRTQYTYKNMKRKVLQIPCTLHSRRIRAAFILHIL
jgi:hypothetical protein